MHFEFSHQFINSKYLYWEKNFYVVFSSRQICVTLSDLFLSFIISEMFYGHRDNKMGYTHFFYKQRFLSNLPQCYLTFTGFELQMSLRYWLKHITIIIPNHILHWVYLCPYLGLGLFIPFVYDLCFIFNLIVIVIKTDALVFCAFFKITPMIFGW